MARPFPAQEAPSDARQSVPSALPSYRPFVAISSLPHGVNVRFHQRFERHVLPQPQSRYNRLARGRARPIAGGSPSALLAGGGLCLAFICAFADGFLTADQMGPAFAWLIQHSPFSMGSGLLSYLSRHWPQPHFHWAPATWVGLGLSTALIGKGSLLPASRLARFIGPRATKNLRILVCIVGTAGAATLISGGGLNTASTTHKALTSSAHTLSLVEVSQRKNN